MATKLSLSNTRQTGNPGHSAAESVVIWQAAMEHIARVILCSGLVAWTIWSTVNHNGAPNLMARSLSFGEMFRTFAVLYLLWKCINSEVDLAVKRISKKLPPGYIGLPVVQDLSMLLRVIKSGWPAVLAKRIPKYGSMFTQRAFGQVNVVVGGEENLSFLFKQDRKGLTAPSWPPNIAMLLGPKSLANQMGKYHRTLRRLMGPFFVPKFVENYFSTMDRVTLDQLESWSSQDGFVSSDVFKLYSLRIFYACSFGYIDEEVVHTLHSDFKTWLKGFLHIITTELPGNPFNESMKARCRIHATLDKLVDKFVSEFPEESEQAQTTLVGRLVYARIDVDGDDEPGGDDDKDGPRQRRMTREEIKDNLLLMIFAGHDTTFASISNILYHLSDNPEAHSLLSDEIATSFPSPHSEFSHETLKNMPLLNAFMHESWRIDPPIVGSYRRALTKIQHKGYTFDEGTIFQYITMMSTNDEDLYTDCKKFHMERFLPEDHPRYLSSIASGIDPSPGRPDYPIFGGGSHVCIGKAFAKMELRLLMARMIQNYHIEVKDPIKVHWPMSSWKLEFKLTKRKVASSS